LTSGIIDDIADVLKIFECSQWACLPIQITFINVFLKGAKEQDLSSLKLRDAVRKYNEEVAGWKQLQIKFMPPKDHLSQIESMNDEIAHGILQHIEDYIFVNQMVTKEELSRMGEGDMQDLVQTSH